MQINQKEVYKFNQNFNFNYNFKLKSFSTKIDTELNNNLNLNLKINNNLNIQDQKSKLKINTIYNKIQNDTNDIIIKKNYLTIVRDTIMFTFNIILMNQIFEINALYDPGANFCVLDESFIDKL